MKSHLISLSIFAIFALLAIKLGQLLPLLGSSIIAILLGIGIRYSPLRHHVNKLIQGLVSKYILKSGIVLLGFSLSFAIVSSVGARVLLILTLGIFVSIGLGLILRKYLGLSFNTGLLLGIGSSICGGAAIVATAPVLEAENEEVAVSITTMLIYSMLAIIIFPLVGKGLAYNDELYGILAGAAVNDTASVIATAFSFSDLAGKYATIVKLVRILYLIPLALVVILIKLKINSQDKKQNILCQIKKVVPIFVIFFILAVIIANSFTISPEISSFISKISKIFMTVGLLSIGMSIDLLQIKKAGLRPVLLGGICWLGVSLSAICCLYLLY